MTWMARTIALCFVSAITAGAHASSLTVSPIMVEAMAPQRNTVLTLRNREARPINVQIRVFKWSQEDGEDRLDPTASVVASPPIVQIDASSDYVVRLSRVEAGEPANEEGYRVIVDELPDLNRQRNGAINVLLRYSVPLFFASPDAGQPKLAWTLGTGGRALTARNDGDRRVQITGLSVKAGQRAVAVAPGLAGYVLGHSVRTWTVPRGKLLASGRVSAGSDHGPINAALLP